ncbi:hypothetical protein F5888DRAFT_1631871 [Russula emetica]|nr:hypothetical protein F5888DRAFT_1631871 [Russula emetica]
MPNDGNGPPSVWSTEVIHAQTRRSRAGSILARLARARPKNIIVASNDPTPILALVDWQSASNRPLWCCDDDDACRQRLRRVFRAVVANDPVFARAVDTDDTCHALGEVAECDVFRDGFLVLSTLQSIVSTPSSTISHKSHKSHERLGGWEHGSGWQREMGTGPGMGRKKGLE